MFLHQQRCIPARAHYSTLRRNLSAFCAHVVGSSGGSRSVVAAPRVGIARLLPRIPQTRPQRFPPQLDATERFPPTPLGGGHRRRSEGVLDLERRPVLGVLQTASDAQLLTLTRVELRCSPRCWFLQAYDGSFPFVVKVLVGSTHGRAAATDRTARCVARPGSVAAVLPVAAGRAAIASPAKRQCSPGRVELATVQRAEIPRR